MRIVLPFRAGAAVNLYSRATGALLNSLPVVAGPNSIDRRPRWPSASANRDPCPGCPLALPPCAEISSSLVLIGGTERGMTATPNHGLERWNWTA